MLKCFSLQPQQQAEKCLKRRSRFLKWLKQLGVPEDISNASLLLQCANSNALSEGKVIHGRIIEGGRDRNGYLSNLLLQMYDDCGCLEDACALFRKMQDRDVFSWGAMIAAYVHRGHGRGALQTFQQMQLEGMIPNKFTFLTILPVYPSHHALSDAKQIHVMITENKLDVDVIVGTSLISMYIKFKGFHHAHQAFDNMPTRNEVCWTAIIAAYVQQGSKNLALQYFRQMLLEGLIPDSITFVGILDACTDLTEVIQIHVYSLSEDYKLDVGVGNVLVDKYAKCSGICKAREVFNRMCNRNSVSWTVMITAYNQHDLSREALQIFQQMFMEGVIPDEVTSITVLSACSSLDSLAEGKRMHTRVQGSIDSSNISVRNSILNLYSKCGTLEDAQVLFDSMSERDIVSWNVMIAAHAQHGQGREAFYLFQQMTQGGLIADKFTCISILKACTSQVALVGGRHTHSLMLDSGLEQDVVTGTALIEMYGKCGSLKAARNVFDSMQEQDLIAWTALITVYVHNENYREALQLFQQMQLECLIPNKVTLVNVLLAHGNRVDLSGCKHMHARAVASKVEEDVVVGTALVHMYSKCGSIAEGKLIFDKLAKRNVFLWNAMVSAYAQCGQGNEAIMLFNYMEPQGMVPDEVTFTSFLAACSHAGLVDEAFQWFASIIRDCYMKPTMDHYACMVDLLVRAGKLEEAEILIGAMPHQPIATLWTTLLGACGVHANVYRGECAAQHAFELAPEDVIPYVTLSNIFVSSGSMDNAIGIRRTVEYADFENQLDDNSGNLHMPLVSTNQGDAQVDLLWPADLLPTAAYS